MECNNVGLVESVKWHGDLVRAMAGSGLSILQGSKPLQNDVARDVSRTLKIHESEAVTREFARCACVEITRRTSRCCDAIKANPRRSSRAGGSSLLMTDGSSSGMHHELVIPTSQSA